MHVGPTNRIPLSIDKNHMKFHKDGLNISHTSYINHVKDRKNKVNTALNMIHRIKKYPRKKKMKIPLVKALILPILMYPILPLHKISDIQIGKLQKYKIKQLRFETNQ